MAIVASVCGRGRTAMGPLVTSVSKPAGNWEGFCSDKKACRLPIGSINWPFGIRADDRGAARQWPRFTAAISAWKLDPVGIPAHSRGMSGAIPPEIIIQELSSMTPAGVALKRAVNALKNVRSLLGSTTSCRHRDSGGLRPPDYALRPLAGSFLVALQLATQTALPSRRPGGAKVDSATPAFVRGRWG